MEAHNRKCKHKLEGSENENESAKIQNRSTNWKMEKGTMAATGHRKFVKFFGFLMVKGVCLNLETHLYHLVITRLDKIDIPA